MSTETATEAMYTDTLVWCRLSRETVTEAMYTDTLIWCRLSRETVTETMYTDTLIWCRLSRETATEAMYTDTLIWCRLSRETAVLRLCMPPPYLIVSTETATEAMYADKWPLSDVDWNSYWGYRVCPRYLIIWCRLRQLLRPLCMPTPLSHWYRESYSVGLCIPASLSDVETATEAMCSDAPIRCRDSYWGYDGMPTPQIHDVETETEAMCTDAPICWDSYWGYVFRHPYLMSRQLLRLCNRTPLSDVETATEAMYGDTPIWCRLKQLLRLCKPDWNLVSNFQNKISRPAFHFIKSWRWFVSLRLTQKCLFLFMETRETNAGTATHGLVMCMVQVLVFLVEKSEEGALWGGIMYENNRLVKPGKLTPSKNMSRFRSRKRWVCFSRASQNGTVSILL